MSITIGYPSFGHLEIFDGKFQGILAPYMNKKVYFPRNFTVKDSTKLTGSIEELLSNEVDLMFTLSRLEELSENITTGAVFNYLQCYLLGKSFLRNVIQHQEVQDMVKEVDLATRILFGLFSFTLVITLKMIDGPTMKNGLWFLVSIFMRQSSILIAKRRCKRILIAMIIFAAFWSQMFLSSIIKTSRLSRPEGIKVETLDDIIRNKFYFAPSTTGKCATLFQKSPESSRKDFADRFFKQEPAKDAGDWIRRYPRLFSLIEDYFAASAIEMACVIEGKTHGQLTQSKKALMGCAESQYFSKNLSKKKQKRLIKWGYASLEMGFYRKEKDFYTGLIQDSLKGRASPDCTTLAELEAEVVPLKFSFFSQFLKFYFFVCYILILLLIYIKVQAAISK